MPINPLLSQIANPQVTNIPQAFMQGIQGQQQLQQGQQQLQQGQQQLQQGQNTLQTQSRTQAAYDAVAAYTMDPEQRTTFLQQAMNKLPADSPMRESYQSIMQLPPDQQDQALLGVIQGAKTAGLLPSQPIDKKGAGTTLMQEAEAMGLAPGTPEYQDYIRSERAKTRAGQTINVGGEQETAFSKELGKLTAAQILDLRDMAQGSVASLNSIKEANKLIKEGVITGRGAGFITGLGSYLQQIGINLAEDTRANTEAFVAAQAPQIAQIIKAFGSGTGLSDKDREFAEAAAGGKIEMTEAAIKKVLRINERIHSFVINRFDKESKLLREAYPGSHIMPLTLGAGVSNPGDQANAAGAPPPQMPVTNPALAREENMPAAATQIPTKLVDDSGRVLELINNQWIDTATGQPYMAGQ